VYVAGSELEETEASRADGLSIQSMPVMCECEAGHQTIEHASIPNGSSLSISNAFLSLIAEDDDRAETDSRPS
jgi:hypothetical protein